MEVSFQLMYIPQEIFDLIGDFYDAIEQGKRITPTRLRASLLNNIFVWDQWWMQSFLVKEIYCGNGEQGIIKLYYHQGNGSTRSVSE